MPHFRHLVPLSLSVLLAVSAATLHAATPPRPNIVFILADDLGYMDIATAIGNSANSARSVI